MNTPNQTKRKLPTQKSIREYWSGNIDLIGLGFDSKSEFLENDICFACGQNDGKAERAHILARVEGGDDSVENLHMLCKGCHKDSEYISGSKYWDWLGNRSIVDSWLSKSFRAGFTLNSLLFCEDFVKSQKTGKLGSPGRL